jgi:hypothetical protein
MTIVFPTLHVRASAQAVPLAAGCLAAALPEPLRATAHLLDFFPGQDLDLVVSGIAALRPDLVAIPLYSWNRAFMSAAVQELRRRLPDAFLVAGGPEATADPDRLLTEGGFHGLVRNEGEFSFRDLALALAEGAGPGPLPGISLATPAGPVHGPERPPAEPDQLPSPWLTGVLRPTKEGGVLWETSRGCPFACDFCYDARGGHGVRQLPEKRLAAELEAFVRAGASQVWVLDSTFNYPPERGRRLLELIQRQAPHLHFHLEAKAEFLDRPTARLLARHSCSLQLGLQSFRPEILRHLHRSFDANLFRRQVQLLNAEGVTFGLDLIYGLPGDDDQGFAASLEAALALRPNHIDLFPLAVLPGTPLYRRRVELGLEADPEPPYLLQTAPGLPASGLDRCRRLAGACDLFYNIGRAVAFFPALLRATGLNAVPFLERFFTWLRTTRGLPEKQILAVADWRPEQVLALQEAFLADLLVECGHAELWPAAHDLMRYHYHYAETLLGPETAPAPPEQLRGRDLWTTTWHTAPEARLVSFHFEILDLLELDDPDLERILQLFRPVGSVALFLRRGNEVLCESLEEDFLTLLRGSDGERAPQEIFGGGVSRGEGEEIVEFAVAEGLLLPPADRSGERTTTLVRQA